MLTPYNNLAIKLSDSLQKRNQLEKIINSFKKNHNLIPCIGVEIEFYLSKNINPSELATYLGIHIKPEKGNHQFEIDLPPSTNIINYIKKITTTKSNIEIIAKKLFGNVNFLAKPFLNDYGNSMHFHINFISPKRSFCINDDFINHAAYSLCYYMLDSFLIFMPNEDDYLRIDKNFMTPVNVSFGGNNRTTAIRIPDSYPKRLEHRIATPLTDPYIAIFTILKSILLGLNSPNNIRKFTKIYGNAFDPQYNLTPLPKSTIESFKLFQPQFFYYNI